VDAYNQFLLVCRENGDSTSMKLFEVIIDEEQSHFNFFDSVAGHIKTLGAAYLSQIAGTPADTGAPARGFVAAEGDG
ncbi:MAG: bacterioferritin, partial [Deltaproteobacteria bacterium]|nr:bacterioferritin [Deltaproteobacteria bacterium]